MERVFISGGAAVLARCALIPRLFSSSIRLPVSTCAAARPTRISSSVGALPVLSWFGSSSLSALAISKSFTRTRSGLGNPACARTVGVTVGVAAQPTISSRQNTAARVNKNPNAWFGSELLLQASIRLGSHCDVDTRRNFSVNITLPFPSLSAACAVSKDRIVLSYLPKEIWSQPVGGTKEGHDLRRSF